MKIKNILAGTISLAMILSLTACGENRTTGSISDNTNNEEYSASQGMAEADNTPVDISDNPDLENLHYYYDSFVDMGTLYLAYYYSEEDYDVIVRNNDGESFVQTSNGSTGIYYDTTKCVYVGENIAHFTDTDIITRLGMAIDAIDIGIATLTTTDITDDIKNSENAEELLTSGNYTRYEIDVNGYDKIKEVYSQVDDAYGQTMVDTLKESIENSADLIDAGEEAGMDTDEISLKYILVVTDDNGLAFCGMYLYFGNELLLTDNSNQNLYIFWWFDQYFVINPWELDDVWYEYDFLSVDAENEDELAEVVEMVNDVAKELDKNVTTFFDAIDSSTDNSETESTETESTETESEGLADGD